MSLGRIRRTLRCRIKYGRWGCPHIERHDPRGLSKRRRRPEPAPRPRPRLEDDALRAALARPPQPPLAPARPAERSHRPGDPTPPRTTASSTPATGVARPTPARPNAGVTAAWLERRNAQAEPPGSTSPDPAGREGRSADT
ncbi:hypothetical protein [Nocardioides sp.]|uniref:hypothetical protein n=1 Tax=Nocardioides sp. TaxID=35761 RepID=UPI003518B68C